MKSKNIKFIAYLRLMDVHPDKVEAFSKGKATYYFDVQEDVWRKLKADFNASPYLNYAQSIEAVKDLAY